MKNKINKYSFSLALIVIAVSVTITSCKKSFLDLSDPTRILTSNYYQDSASMSTAVIATYASLQSVYGKSGGSMGLFPYGEISSDNSTTVVDGSGIGDFEYFTLASSNPILESSWTYSYKSIALCNTVLGNIDSVKMDTAIKSRWQSEVKFIRALDYFNLVRIWGAVPLVTTVLTTSNAYQYGRVSVDTVYAQIEKDLTDADADVNLAVQYASVNDLGRVTKPAVEGLLAKVYLTENKYSNAATELSQFINNYGASGTCTLQPSYSSIFSTSNEMNSEIVFAVRYQKGNVPITGSPFTNYFASGSANTGGVGTAYIYNTLTQGLVDTMLANPATDTRTTASYSKVNGFYATKKYTDVPATNLDANCSWIVLRYADILLMYAEALNEQSASNVAMAVPYINRVRTRAGISPLLTTLTQSQLRLAIEDERRIELNLEGHRWFDLVRTGRAITVMNNYFTKYNIRPNASAPVVQIDAHNLLFPIPIKEINTSPILTQNPGY
jgi:hypothetical protein